MARVSWSEAAERDLSELIDRAARYNNTYALRLADSIIGKVRILEQQPYHGREVEEFAMESLRELIVPPYRIVYSADGPACMVHGIFNDYQDLPTALKRRLPRP